MLCQQANLQIELGSLIGCCGHSVLTDQHKGRQENGFYRCSHCEDDERGIQPLYARDDPNVYSDPQTKNRQMHIHKTHAAGKCRNSSSQTLLKGSLLLFARASLLESANVAFEYGAQTRRLRGRRRGSRNLAHLPSCGSNLGTFPPLVAAKLGNARERPCLQNVISRPA